MNVEEIFVADGVKGIRRYLNGFTNSTKIYDNIEDYSEIELSTWPYEDQEFSLDFLDIHLDQRHDQASRRISIQTQLLDKWYLKKLQMKNQLIYHPLCGPGIFAKLISQKGIQGYRGVDISPSIIHWAKKTASSINFQFIEKNIFEDFSCLSTMYSLSFLTYEALNHFTLKSARKLLTSMDAVLGKGAKIAGEVRTFDSTDHKYPVYGRTSTIHKKSFFYKKPHTVLSDFGIIKSESNYLAKRFFIYDKNSDRVEKHFLNFTWLPSIQEFQKLISMTGFKFEFLEQPKFDFMENTESYDNYFFVIKKND